MKAFTVGILACSLVRGLPGDLVAMKCKVKAADRAYAAIGAYPWISQAVTEGLQDPTIKYVSVFVGRADVPSELPMRQHPFRYRVADGALLDGDHIIARISRNGELMR